MCEVCGNACLNAKGIYKSLKLKLSINSHNLVDRFLCSRKSNCMNSKCDSFSTPPQWENDGSASSEDEDSLNDLNNDVERKTVTFLFLSSPEQFFCPEI